MKYTPSVLLLSLISSAAAAPFDLVTRYGQCSSSSDCAAGSCCSQYGYCGSGSEYCGSASLSPPSDPTPFLPPPPPSTWFPPAPPPGGALHPPSRDLSPSSPAPGGSPDSYPGLDETQSRNAAAAIAEVRAEGLGRQACLAVISTALQESTLHIYANQVVPASLNYPHDIVGGDQDSIGMFQQRPEWYPDIEADMSAAGSTRQFLAAMKQVAGWETMEVSALDQAVQRAEAGNLYAQRLPLANQVCTAAGF